MIHGIGVDLLKTTRIVDLYARRGDKFLHKALHPCEIKKFLELSDNTVKQNQYLANMLVKSYFLLIFVNFT